MNKLTTTISFFLISFFAGAQWSLTGNTGTTSSNYVGTTDANPLVFRTNGTEQFRLTPAGNIMVGKTTDDNRRLSVLGKVRVETSEALGFTIGTTPVHSQFSFDGISGSTSISLLYSRNFSTNANGSSSITGNGTAGDPANYLFLMSGAHIVGYQQPVVVKRFYPQYGSSFTVDDDGQVGVYPSDYRITSFNLNGTVKAYIDKDGGAQFNGATRIGNTTAQASAILEVASTSQGFLPPRMSTVQKTTISAPATGLLVYDNSLNNYSYYNGSAWQSLGGSTQWSISGSDILYNTGNVAIGTTNTSTGYKLAVGGNIIAEKVKVKLQASGWPDYVFGKEYRLIDLKSLEQFINQHGHLPEVPTAKEVEEQNLDLGNNQAILLKKIEELTLYVIELKKQNDEQDKEIRELKKKIEH